MGLSVQERLAVCSCDPVRTLGEATVAVGPGVRVDEGVTLRGRVALGLASSVCKDSRLEDTVLMPETWVGPGCRLERTVVAQGIELPAGFEVEQAMICRDPDPSMALPDSTRREGGVLVHSFDLQSV
jgi:ADP-glucose pyrophosphorylase